MDNTAHAIESDVLNNVILGVAHELNNPNTFIRVNAVNIKSLVALLQPCMDHYLEKHGDEKLGPFTVAELRVRLNQQVEGILDASMRIVSIADKLRHCTTVDFVEQESVSLHDILQNSVEMHNFLMPGTSSIKFDCPEGYDLFVMGHQLQLEQMISIFLTNAVDAINERLESNPDLTPELTVRLSNDCGRAHVSIKDSGCGFDAGTKQRIFSPFFTTKAQGKGQGLGLSICRAIVANHEGDISVNSQPNVGTEFIVHFPIEEEVMP